MFFYLYSKGIMILLDLGLLYFLCLQSSENFVYVKCIHNYFGANDNIS